jgi:hypothetical protein
LPYENAACYLLSNMSTLAEIEAAVDALPEEQKEELFLFLATRLRSGNPQMPAPREFSEDQIREWIADDEDGYRSFKSTE